MKNSNVIKVTVVDFNNQSLNNAKVIISTKREKANLKFDEYLGAYCLEKFLPGKYDISVVASGFEKQQKEVFIGASGIEEIFILGKEGMPFYYRGYVKVPFSYHDENFGIALSSPRKQKAN